MTKTELIFEIQKMNPGAAASYLASFDQDELEFYLDRLKYARSPRPSVVLWTRSTNSEAHASEPVMVTSV